MNYALPLFQHLAGCIIGSLCSLLIIHVVNFVNKISVEVLFHATDVFIILLCQMC